MWKSFKNTLSVKNNKFVLSSDKLLSITIVSLLFLQNILHGCLITEAIFLFLKLLCSQQQTTPLQSNTMLGISLICYRYNFTHAVNLRFRITLSLFFFSLRILLFAYHFDFSFGFTIYTVKTATSSSKKLTLCFFLKHCVNPKY